MKSIEPPDEELAPPPAPATVKVAVWDLPTRLFHWALVALLALRWWSGKEDELELHIVPVLLGDGARLFDNLGGAEIELEQVRAVEAPGVTHLKYRVMP